MPSPRSLANTIYSLLDGIIRIPELVKRVKNLGMSSVAITDHGNLHGIIEFYKVCRKEGIHPVVGVEAYLTQDEDGLEKNKTRDNYHCVLLAKNNDGLKTLYSLANNAAFSNFYYKPRICIGNLKRCDLSGLIATSACLGGVVAKQGSFDEGSKSFIDTDGKAIETLNLFKDLFNNNFYAEIQDNPEFWEQEAYNNWLIKNAKKEGVPLVITSDAHFLTKEDKSIHNLVMAQQMKKTLEEYSCDEDGMAYGEGHYIRSSDEMLQAALKYGVEEVFWNTTEISKKCDVEITLGEYINPHFDITKEEDYNEFLRYKAELLRE